MAWTGQWSIKVDGNELNSLTTGGPYSTVIPELDWVFEQDVKLVPIDGDYPAFVGLQPREGNYTLLIQMTACSDSVYDTRLAQLKGWLTPGMHTFVVQVRGMSSTKTFKAIVRSIATEFRLRRVTCLTTAPKPVLT